MQLVGLASTLAAQWRRHQASNLGTAGVSPIWGTCTLEMRGQGMWRFGGGGGAATKAESVCRATSECAHGGEKGGGWSTLHGAPVSKEQCPAGGVRPVAGRGGLVRGHGCALMEGATGQKGRLCWSVARAPAPWTARGLWGSVEGGGGFHTGRAVREGVEVRWSAV